MARNRFNYTDGGGYEVDAAEDRAAGVPQDEPVPNAGGSQTAPEAPSADPAPGPNSNPAPQGGNPNPPAPPPPAVVSSVPGIKASEATGGVQGSFGQAGTAGFSRRFGQPAAWFRGGVPGQGLERMVARERASGQGRGILAKLAAGGGVGGGTVANVPNPSSGLEGGGKNDEEFQRLLQAVMAQRFGGGR